MKESKVDYGSQNQEEESAFIRRVVAPPQRNDNARRRQKRLVAVGASVALLAAGALATYAALPGENATAITTGENLESQTFVIPADDSNDDDDTGESQYVPTFSQYDTNGDGVATVGEYLVQLASYRDDAIQRVADDDLSEDEKADYTARLQRNYDKQAACVTRLASRDKANNGAVTEDRFALFYNMIDEFCIIDDVKIPEQYRPTAEPPADNTPSTPDEQPSQPEDNYAPERPSEDNTPSQPEDNYTPERPSEDNTPSQPEDNYAPEQPSEDNTPSQPEDNYTPEQPSEDNTPSQPEDSNANGPSATPSDDFTVISDTPTVSPDTLYMTKPEFRAKIAKHFENQANDISMQLEYAELAFKKAHLLKDLLEECINQASNRFGYYGIYEQDQVFNDAVTWIVNDCLAT